MPRRNLPSLIRPLRGRKRIGRYITAQTQREFRPLQRELARQRRQLRGTQRQIRRSYRGANQATRNLASNVASAHESSAQTLGSILANLNQSSLGMANQGISEQAASAAARGGLDQSAALRQQAQAGAEAGNQVAAAQLGALLSQGQAARTGLMSTIAANNARRQQDMGKVRSQRADLRRDRLEMARERGRFRNEALEKLVDRERNFYVQRLAFAGDAADRAVRDRYTDAVFDQSEKGLQGRRVTARAMERQARINARNRRQRERAAVRRHSRRGARILEDLLKENPLTVKQLEEDRRGLVNALVRRYNLDVRAARRAVERVIKKRRRIEATTNPGGRPATGNTFLPGVENPAP